MDIPTKPEMVRICAISIDVEHKIDGLLAENRFDDAASILLSDNMEPLSILDRNIYILRIMAQIYLVEKIHKVDRGIFVGRNVQEIIRLYRIISMYLKRLEHNFPLDLQKEIVNYIVNNEISIEAIVGMINYNSSLVNKDKIIDQLKNVTEQY